MIETKGKVRVGTTQSRLSPSSLLQFLTSFILHPRARDCPAVVCGPRPMLGAWGL